MPVPEGSGADLPGAQVDIRRPTAAADARRRTSSKKFSTNAMRGVGGRLEIVVHSRIGSA
jgi:hypothetical protein